MSKWILIDFMFNFVPTAVLYIIEALFNFYFFVLFLVSNTSKSNGDQFCHGVMISLSWSCTHVRDRVQCPAHYTDRMKYQTMTEILFKVIIIGDPTVGKTSFVQRYVNDAYRRDYKMTIGGKDLWIKGAGWSTNYSLNGWSGPWEEELYNYKDIAQYFKF